MRKRILFVIGFALVLLTVNQKVYSAGKDTETYWQWGDGIWTMRVGSMVDPIYYARYDWGGITSYGQDTVDFCNKVLKINPDFKFILRIWPPGFRGKALGDYFYKPGFKKQTMKAIEAQITIFKTGLSNPDSVMAIHLCEEMPGYIGGRLFRKKNEKEIPGCIKDHAAIIEKELGEPWNGTKKEHRQWFAKKYIQALKEINGKFKEEWPGIKTIYWMHGAYKHLDSTGVDMFDAFTLPLKLTDIVPGICDVVKLGLNKRNINDLVRLSEKNKFYFISQVSTPAFMRLMKFDKAYKLAATKTKWNLGIYFFIGYGEESTPWAWNAIPESRTTQWTYRQQLKWIGWKYKIGLPVLKNYFRPKIKMYYDLSGKKAEEFSHVWLSVQNTGDSSWFNGDSDVAKLENLRIKLKQTPYGFSAPAGNNPPKIVKIGELLDKEAIAVDYWIRKEKNEPYKNSPFVFEITNSTNGKKIYKFVGEGAKIIPSEYQNIPLSGYSWLEPNYSGKRKIEGIKITPYNTDLYSPSLKSGFTECKFSSVIPKEYSLLILKNKAFLKAKNMFSRKGVEKYNKKDDGYAVIEKKDRLTEPYSRVIPGNKYNLFIQGYKKGDGKINIRLRFLGRRTTSNKKESVVKTIGIQFNDKLSTVKVEFKAPDDFKAVQVMMQLIGIKGNVYIKSYELKSTENVVIDVSDKLSGRIPELTKPFSKWTYSDYSKVYRLLPLCKIEVINDKENVKIEELNIEVQ